MPPFLMKKVRSPPRCDLFCHGRLDLASLTSPSSNQLKVRHFSFMAASNPAMTAEFFRKRQSFSHSLSRE
jgi:hypothetical protein